MNIFRIKSKDYKPNAPAVFLQHGITDSADCWIMNKPETSPAFVLLRAGYDVWLGNQRGTKYSRAHATLNPDKDKAAYWGFSWTDMGDFDAPS